jgi:hypothetical protein
MGEPAGVPLALILHRPGRHPRPAAQGNVALMLTEALTEWKPHWRRLLAPALALPEPDAGSEPAAALTPASGPQPARPFCLRLRDYGKQPQAA